MDLAVLGDDLVSFRGVVDCCIEVSVHVVGGGGGGGLDDYTRVVVVIALRIAETHVHAVLAGPVEDGLHAGRFRGVPLDVALKVRLEFLGVREQRPWEESRQCEFRVDDQLDLSGVRGGHER